MPGCRPLTNDEVKSIIEKGFPPERMHAVRDKFFFLTAIATALRSFEITGLTLGQLVQFRGGKVILDKGKPISLQSLRVLPSALKGGKKAKTSVESRDVLLPDWYRSAISQYVLVYQAEHGIEAQPTSFAFPNGRGSHVGNRMVQFICEHMFTAAGINVSHDHTLGCHSFRKTALAEAWLASGKDVMVCMKFLNHKSLNSTVRYLNSDAEQVRELQRAAFGSIFNPMLDVATPAAQAETSKQTMAQTIIQPGEMDEPDFT